MFITYIYVYTCFILKYYTDISFYISILFIFNNSAQFCSIFHIL